MLRARHTQGPTARHRGMIERSLFTPEHEIFRDSVRRFVEKEITPYHAQWESDGRVPRDVSRTEIGRATCAEGV